MSSSSSSRTESHRNIHQNTSVSAAFHHILPLSCRFLIFLSHAIYYYVPNHLSSNLFYSLNTLQQLLLSRLLRPLFKKYHTCSSLPHNTSTDMARNDMTQPFLKCTKSTKQTNQSLYITVISSFVLCMKLLIVTLSRFHFFTVNVRQQTQVTDKVHILCRGWSSETLSDLLLPSATGSEPSKIWKYPFKKIHLAII